MQSSPADKFAFLEPWCAVLRGKLAAERRCLNQSALREEYWWVSVRPPPSLMAILDREATDVRLMREALELLSLVAIVDNEAWKFLLLRCCDLKLEDDDDSLDGEFAPRFLLRFDAKHLRYSALLPSATIRQFFLPRPPLHQTKTAENGSRTSAGFQDALLTILAFHRAAGGRQEVVNRWRKIPYALRFADLWNVGQPALAAHLRSLLVTLDEVRKHNEWLAGERETKRRLLAIDQEGNESHGPLTYYNDDGAADGHYFAYELESVQMCYGVIPVSHEMPNVLLTALGMPRVTFSELDLSLEQDNNTGYVRPGDVHSRTEAAHYRTGLLFNTIFGGRSIMTRKNDQPQTVRRCTIEWLTMPMFGIDDQTFSGLCASLAEASGVRRLTLNGAFRPVTPAQRTWRWQWLAYALFSEGSRSSIQEINLLGVEVSDTDVDAIAEVLSTHVPEPGQATETAEAAYADGGKGIEYVYVPKGTSVKIKESIASPSSSFSLDTVDNFEFRLLQHDHESDWVNVLVPGHGNGVISRSEICVQAEKKLPQPSRSPHGVTSLSLSIDSNMEQDMSTLMRLIQLIGRSLEKLSIQTLEPTTLDTHAILKACPKLNQLFLDSVQIDLDILMREVEKGSTKIRSFGFYNYSVPAEVITRFTKKLGDTKSALANGMRKLCLGADNEEFPTTDESVQALLDVLKTNHTLIDLDLWVLPALFNKYAAAFRQHHQETLCVEKEKLPLRCRLAFLSVVRGNSTPVNDLFLHLDTHLLETIFSFAAVSAKRTICIQCI
ncbi:unnamed protein product [Phytophthora lilii]|uniref:Unnamed protein product n=1 Tax=Phytophthora lilii TaxID=2077276 RepID=A0A9W6WG17_9STRA|nr:unnamed protein product [Phytophthora lilii]